MTEDMHDPILDAFTRRLAAVELLVPPKPPALPGSASGSKITVVGGMAVRPTGRVGSTSTRRNILAPVGLAAAVVIGLVGASLLAGGGTGPGTSPIPSPTSSPSTVPPSAPAGVVYQSVNFERPVAATLGDGWSRVADTNGELTFDLPITTGANPETGSVMIADLDLVSIDPCPASGIGGATQIWRPATPAVGPQHLMDWIESTSGVPHDPPKPVTIGGISGLETTLSPGVGSLQACAGTAYLGDLTSGRSLKIAENEATRIAAIVLGDRTILVVTDVPRAALFADFASKADQLIDTFDFAPTN